MEINACSLSPKLCTSTLDWVAESATSTKMFTYCPKEWVTGSTKDILLYF